MNAMFEGIDSLSNVHRANASFSSNSNWTIGQVATSSPIDLNSTSQLAIAENQPVGTIVGEFNATDLEGDAITFHLPAGENNNFLFTIDSNGTLKTATTFDYETNASSYTITVQAKDEYNAFVEGNLRLLSRMYSRFGWGRDIQITRSQIKWTDFPMRRKLPLVRQPYEFVADNVSMSHPFMIGESYGDTSSSLWSYWGD